MLLLPTVYQRIWHICSRLSRKEKSRNRSETRRSVHCLASCLTLVRTMRVSALRPRRTNSTKSTRLTLCASPCRLSSAIRPTAQGSDCSLKERRKSSWRSQSYLFCIICYRWITKQEDFYWARLSMSHGVLQSLPKGNVFNNCLNLPKLLGCRRYAGKLFHNLSRAVYCSG